MIIQSLLLDYRFLKLPYLSLYFKLTFLLKKYYLIIKHLFFKIQFHTGNFTFLDGRKVYYNTKYGISDYQSILVRHYNILQKYVNKIANLNIVFDVGCNVGLFTKFLNQSFKPSYIYAIDPLDNVINLAKENNINEDNIIYINKGLSDKPGLNSIALNPDNTYMASLSVGSLQENTLLKTVDLDTVDNICDEYNIESIDFMKIDVEGWEYEVLKGAKNILKKTKILLVEIEVTNPRGITFPQLLSLLSGDVDFDMVSMINFDQIREGEILVGDFLFINKNYFDCL